VLVLPGIEWTDESRLAEEWTGRSRTPTLDGVLTSKGAATRQRIIEGTARLMRERGPADVGLDDVRAATSTSKSQLFHYFPDGKADLLLAVARHEADQVLADQQPELGHLETWPDWEAWQRRVVAKYQAQGRRCPLAALTAQLGKGDPATIAVVTDLYDRWQGHLRAGVQALRDAGEIDPDTDVDRVATAVVTAVAGGATLLISTGRVDYLEAALGEALDNLSPRGRVDS
jgi:AcrR family transcriptional regulator